MSRDVSNEEKIAILERMISTPDGRKKLVAATMGFTCPVCKFHHRDFTYGDRHSEEECMLFHTLER